MSRIYFDIGISLDGFMAGENRGPKNPLGDDGVSIHNWMFAQKTFWKHIGGDGGTDDGPDGRLIDDTFERAGAYIMGKRMFEEGEANWKEDLFKADVYVLTHEKRDPWIQKGTTRFYFINDGIESALEKARLSAKGKDIRIQGGANIIQQYFNAGYIDDFFIHIAPVFIGKGLRLFDKIDKSRYEASIKDVIHSPLTTHIKYTLTKKGK